MPGKSTYQELEKQILDLKERLHGQNINRKVGQQDPVMADYSLFKSLFENMSSGCAIYEVINGGTKGSDYIIRGFNRVSLKLEGKTLDQVIGKSLFDLRPTIDDYGLIPVLKRVWETGVPEYFPIKIYQDDIFSNYYENYVYKIHSGEVIAVYNDVTDQKNNEIALKKSQERFKLAMQFTNDGLYDWSLETNEIFYSDGWKRMLGYEPDEIKNDFSEWERLISPEDIKASWDMLNDVITKKRARFELEFKMKHKNGSWVDILSRANVVFNSKDEAVRVVGTHVDITERKRFERELDQKTHDLTKRNKELKALYTISIILKNETKQDVIFEKIVNVLPDAWQYPADTCARIIFNEKQYTSANFCPSKWKQKAPILISGQPVGSLEIYYRVQKPLINTSPFLEDEGLLIGEISNKISRYFGEVKSESDKIELQKRLQHIQRLESIGTLSGGIAHDFNNILFPIIGFTEMSMDDLPKDHPVQENLDDILQGAKRARDLIKQILSFSKQSDLDQIVFPFQPLIAETLKLLRSILPSNIDIQKRFMDDDIFIYGNKTEIHEVIMNICTNAFHAMEAKGGRLIVELNISPPPLSLNLSLKEYCCLTIKDTGTGIPDDILSKIYDPYFTTKDQGKGTGLGLSVSHGIVDALKGGINIETKIGEGTSVFIYFLTASKNEFKEKEISENKNMSGNERILFVDDEKTIVKLGTRLLEKFGYQVIGATNSVDAFKTFKTNPQNIDLVITDMTMPVMLGTELSEKILKIRSDIPILICTGFSERIDKKSVKKLGIQGYINKPILLDELISKVRELLDHKNRIVPYDGVH